MGPQPAPVAPEVSVKEVLTGMQPVRNRIGQPVLSAQANKEIRKALSKYDTCDSYCCRRDMLAKAVGAASVVVGAPALAAATTEVLLGGAGGLVFEPSDITVCTGDTVKWVNNKLFPHNVVFDEDNVPDGVDADSISYSGLLSKAGETHSATFTVPGKYAYFCVPHRGGGMVGSVTVQG